jgi:3-dehydroquinate synthase
MPRVHVDLAERSYDIIIGAGVLESAAEHLRSIVAGRRLAVVTDAVVKQHYLPSMQSALDDISSRWDTYCIDGGESAKSFAGLESLLTQMLSDGVDRGSVLMAFGGGVVGDVGGFAAALLMRGIELIQVPTTLMSQVDSAVGGKNAINTSHGKNLVGSFLQPRIVLNDVSVLRSLPAGELRSGYGEIIKYGLLRGEQQFSWLEHNAHALLAHETEVLTEAVRMGCETKAQIVSEDERDHGKRALVNLGHTFAHAFETQAGFGAFPHGVAVAVGLIAACELSERSGACSTGLADRVRSHTHAVGLATDLPGLSQAVDWSALELHAHMAHDKKTVDGQINFVLLNEVGKPFVTKDISAEHVRESLVALGASSCK